MFDLQFIDSQKYLTVKLQNIMTGFENSEEGKSLKTIKVMDPFGPKKS